VHRLLLSLNGNGPKQKPSSLTGAFCRSVLPRGAAFLDVWPVNGSNLTNLKFASDRQASARPLADMKLGTKRGRKRKAVVEEVCEEALAEVEAARAP
jgi:hypothetical protein